MKNKTKNKNTTHLNFIRIIGISSIHFAENKSEKKKKNKYKKKTKTKKNV